MATQKTPKKKDNLPTMPSVFFTDGMANLGLEKFVKTKQAGKICEEADNFQLKNCPGRPHITMAAFTDRLTYKIGVYRTQVQIAKAYRTSDVAIRERLKRM